jgi:glutathione S-transferase
MAPLGTSGYYTTLGHLSYICSELQTVFAHLFNPSFPEEMKEIMRTKLQGKLHYMNSNIFIDGRQFLVGHSFSVCDAYLYVVLSWSAHGEVELDGCKYMKRYYDRLSTLPAVAEAFSLMDHNPTATLRGI